MGEQFIRTIAADFAEMGYRPTDAVSLDELRVCAFNTMFHCPDPETAAVRESLVYCTIKAADYNRVTLYGEHMKPVCSIVSNPETKDILLMDCLLLYAVLDYNGSLQIDTEFLLMLAYGYIYLMYQNNAHDLSSKGNKIFGII